MRDRMLLRIGQGGPFELLLALQERLGVAFQRIGQQLDEHIQQTLDAGASAGRDEADRDEVSLAQRLFERRVQLLGLQILALLQVQRHQVFVHLDHLIDQGGVGGGNTGKIAVSGGVEKAVRHPGSAVGRQVDRQAFAAERLLNLLQQAGQVDVVGVDLVDDDHPALPAFGGALHHPLGDRLDPGLRVDHHCDGLHRRQHGDGLADEIREAGGIDQIDVGAVVVEIDQRGVERVLVRWHGKEWIPPGWFSQPRHARPGRCCGWTRWCS